MGGGANLLLRSARLPRRQRPRPLGRGPALLGAPRGGHRELTKILNQAVSGRACAAVARDLGLPEMLTDHSPSEGDGLPVETLLASERTLASVCEAVIGACYLDHGFQRTSAAVAAAFDEEIEQATLERLDFKSELQERLARQGETVLYEVSSEAGRPMTAASGFGRRWPGMRSALAREEARRKPSRRRRARSRT